MPLSREPSESRGVVRTGGNGLWPAHQAAGKRGNMEGEETELARLVAREATQRLRYERLKGGRQPNSLTIPRPQDAPVIRAAEALWLEAADRVRAYQVGRAR
jgi:hypothetical protein